jgi:hypothetical protein
MVKKLRYYARFVVVCLLLQKHAYVKDLIREFGRQIDDYVKVYDPSDQLEWQMVKNEINEFIDADCILNIEPTTSSTKNKNKTNTNGNSQTIVTLSNRLTSNCVPTFDFNNRQTSTSSVTTASNIRLKEVVIVGNCLDQVKKQNKILHSLRLSHLCLFYLHNILRLNLVNCRLTCIECYKL